MFKIVFSKSPFLASFFVVLPNFILCLLLFSTRLSNDDWIIAQYISGTLMSDAPAEFLIYTHTFIGLIISFLYKNFPYIPWYGIYLYFILFVSSWLILYAMLRVRFSVERILLFTLFFYLVFGKMFLEVHYSAIAAYTTLSGLFLFLSTLSRPSKKVLVLSSFMLWIGFLIRKESGFLLTCATLAPAFLFFLYQHYKNLKIKYLVIYFIASALLILGSYWFDMSYYTKHQQMERLEMNKKLNYFYNADMLHYNQYPELYKQVGLTKTDYFMGLHLYNYHDKDIFTTERIDKLLAGNDLFTWKYIKMRGIRECYAGLMDIAKSVFFDMAFLLIASLAMQKLSKMNIIAYFITLVNINLGLILLFFFMHIVYAPTMVMYPAFFLLIIYHGDREILTNKYKFFILLIFAIFFGITFKNLLDKNAEKKAYIQKNHDFLTQLSEDKLYILWDGNSDISGIGAFDDIKKYSNKDIILILYYTDAPTVLQKFQKFNINNINKDIINHKQVLLGAGAGQRPHYVNYMKQHYGYDLKLIKRQTIGEINFYEVVK